MKSFVRSKPIDALPSKGRGTWRRFALGLLAALALVGCATVGAADEAAKKAPALPAAMDDPLLGLSYDTTKIRFERLPDTIAKKADLGTPQWIYARSGNGAITYYVVSGFLRIESDDPSHPGSTMEPDFGAVLKQTEASVEILGVPDLLFDTTPLIPAADLDTLLADAARRYVKAWGKAALQTQLTKESRPDVVPVPLRKALEVEGVVIGEP
jgi:hypothetical protein